MHIKPGVDKLTNRSTRIVQPTRHAPRRSLEMEGALQGVRIVDMTAIVPMPFCAWCWRISPRSPNKNPVLRRQRLRNRCRTMFCRGYGGQPAKRSRGFVHDETYLTTLAAVHNFTDRHPIACVAPTRRSAPGTVVLLCQNEPTDWRIDGTLHMLHVYLDPDVIGNSRRLSGLSLPFRDPLLAQLGREIALAPRETSTWR
jgi:hypothetical protein